MANESLEDTRAFNTRYLTLMEEATGRKGVASHLTLRLEAIVA